MEKPEASHKLILLELQYELKICVCMYVCVLLKMHVTFANGRDVAPVPPQGHNIAGSHVEWASWVTLYNCQNKKRIEQTRQIIDLIEYV